MTSSNDEIQRQTLILYCLPKKNMMFFFQTIFLGLIAVKCVWIAVIRQQIKDNENNINKVFTLM